MSKTDTSPISGLRGVDHIGFTVPDIEEATRFFETVLGASRIFDAGPFKAEDNWKAMNIGVDPRAEVKMLRMLQLANGPCLELFEYIAPGQRDVLPKNSDIGGHHIAFYVDDIEQSVEQLKAHDIEVQGDVKGFDNGPNAGLRWVYFKAPWGMQLELVSYPNGIASFKGRTPLVWKPKKLKEI